MASFIWFLTAVCRGATRTLGLYLMPWARACDVLAQYAAARYPVLLPYTWSVAACLLSGIFGLHLLGIAAASSTLMRHALGPTGPCVCTAPMQHASDPHAICLEFRRGDVRQNLVSLACSLSVALTCLFDLGATCMWALMSHPWVLVGLGLLSAGSALAP